MTRRLDLVGGSNVVRRRLAVVAAVAVASLLLAACGGGGATIDASQGDVAAGRAAFDTYCAACHGEELRGTSSGPPLLSDIYVPSHHADAAFVLAIKRGVQPHHFDFGPMAAIPGLSDQQIADIIAYVRDEQRAAGLIE